MGQTQLPAEVIADYLESLKQIYTPESYDLFAHNCNNFSNDFAMFLVGKGIPSHITSLPETVLNTPFGLMLKPQLDASMRSITQAPVPPQNVPRPVSTQQTPATKPAAPEPKAAAHGEVYNITQRSALDSLLSRAAKSCAVVFFTSSTCAPCKIAYPVYDSLAAENPSVPFIKIDINQADEIGDQYQIRRTPTFMTFLHGQKDNEWTGASPPQIRGNVDLLIQQAFPAHPHTTLRVPTLQSGSLRPVSFAKIPPLDKVIAKMGPSASDPAVHALKEFLVTRQAAGAAEAPLPDLNVVAQFLRAATKEMSPDTLFTAYDLLRCALLDPRVSGWFAEEAGPSSPSTLLFLLTHITQLIANDSCPYNLRLTAIQLGCNLFLSPLSTKTVLSSEDLSSTLIQLAASSLLSEPDKPAARSAAASLAFNLATANYRVRREESREGLNESCQVELAAGLLEFIGSEVESQSEKKDMVQGTESLHAALLALGYLVYYAPVDGELWDLSKALDAKGTVKRVKESNDTVGKIAREVGEVLPASE